MLWRVFRDADITERAARVRLIDCFVNAVYIYDNGKTVVTLNYKDGATQVRPADVAQSFGSTMTLFGAVGENRTHNPAITSGVLYL